MIWSYWPQDLIYFVNHLTLLITVWAVLLILIHHFFLLLKISVKKLWINIASASASILFLPLSAAWIGPLSVTSALWAIYQILSVSSYKNFTLHDSEQKFLVIFLGVIGLILYPLSEGLFIWDVYRLGWHPLASFILLGFLIFFTFKKWQTLFCGLILILIVDVLNVLPSDNLWDILLDPFAVVGACIYLVKEYFFKTKNLRSL
ncbi:MAG: hypothetical protein V4629_10770 [Pseudomonadota bacterium]